MSNRKVNIDDLYSQYPFVGTITEWNTDKTGKIRGQIYPMTKDYFMHLTGYQGYQNREALRNLNLLKERCLFVLGTSPHHYKLSRKQSETVIAWILESDIIGGIDNYIQRRSMIINQWNKNEFFHAIKADWYKRIWKKYGYIWPAIQLNIGIDNSLHKAIRQFELGIKTFEDWQVWLEIKLDSPIFIRTDLQKRDLRLELVKTLETKEPDFFQDTSPENFLNFYLQYQGSFSEEWFWRNLPGVKTLFNRHELISILEKFSISKKSIEPLSSVLVNECISLDIEGNDEEIHQLGWVKSGRNYIKDQLNSKLAINRCLENIESQIQNEDVQWLTGHNIIQWDLPILRKFNKDFLSNLEIWDTLLVSWILDPWQQSHALVAGENAHRADIDAEAVIQKLREQLKRFPEFFLKDQCLAPQNPIDVIFINNKILDQISERKYPSLSGVNLHLLTKKIIVSPKWRILKEFAWRPSVIHTYADAKILSPALLTESVQRKPDNYALKALACVVSHAAQNNVQVTTQMIPSWLEEQVCGILESCLLESESLDIFNTQKHVKVTTYEDFKDILDFPTSEYTCLHPEEGYLAELKISHVQKSWQVSSLLGDQEEYYDSHMIFRVNEYSNGLEGIKNIDLDRQSLWIEYNPIFAKQEGYRAWRAYKFWRHSALSYQFQIERDNQELNKSIAVVLPSPLTNNPLPCTARNRSLYWRDTLERFLNLLQTSSDESNFVLLVAHRHEVEPIRAVLEHFQQTRPKKEYYTTLRYLEHLHHSGKRSSCRYCAVDHQSNAHHWLEASQELGYPVQLVFDSLPLHEWWMQIAPTNNDLEVFDDVDESVIELQNEDESYWASEDDEDLESRDEKSRLLAKNLTNTSSFRSKKLVSRVHLSPWNIKLCIRYGLCVWLRVILRRDQDNIPEVTILDSRCHPSSFKGVCSTRQLDLVSSSLKLFLDHNRLLDELRKELGDIERQEAPTSYETYEKFLKKYWGYDSFRESQIEALKAIITNQQDVLVRLPTGEGKSVLFHIPALLRGHYTQRLTIVITPLKALMADQVLSLWDKGFFDAVDYLSSDRAPWEMDEIYQGIVDNRIKLLFVAPERFRVNRFREAIDSRYRSDNGFEYIVVDEAHCVSQWGFEFRPDYLYALEVIRDYYRLPNSKGRRSPILLLSATVTKAVQDSLEKIIGIQENDRDKTYIVQPPGPCKPIQDFLDLEVEQVSDGAYGRDGNLSTRKGFVEKSLEDLNIDTSSAIIFATRRRHAETFVEILNDGNTHDMEISYFHAGLPTEVRVELYKSFKNKDINLLVSTKAFGMGMDIPHIHFCTHLTPPSSLEDYLQEVGRVGRSEEDRKLADLSTIKCKLLYADDDFSMNHSQIQSSRITRPRLSSLWQEILNRKQFIRDTHQEICVISANSFGEITSPTILRNAIFWLEKLERISLKEQFGKFLKVKLNRSRLEWESRRDSDISPITQLLLLLYTNSGMTGHLDNHVKPVFDERRFYIGFLIQSPKDKQNNDLFGESWDEAELNLDAIIRALRISGVGEVFNLFFKLKKSICIQVIQEIDFIPGSFLDYRHQILGWLNNICHWILNSQRQNRNILLEELERYSDEQIGDQLEEGWNSKKIEIVRRKVVRSAIKLLRAAGVKIQQRASEEESILSYDVKNLAQVNQAFDEISKSIENILYFLQSQSRVTLDDFWNAVKFRQNTLPIQPHNTREFKAILSILSCLDLYKVQQEMTSRSYLVEILKPGKYQTDENEEFTEEEETILAELDKANTFSILRSYAIALYAKLPDSQARRDFIDKYFRISTVEEMLLLLEQIALSSDDDNDDFQELRRQIKEEAINQLTEQLKVNPQQDLVANYPYYQHALVNAGPGAGKTHVLVSRCVLLIHKQQLQPQDILVLAFNRAVVYEIRKRVNQVFSDLGYSGYARQLKVYTFHSLAKKYLNSLPSQKDGIDGILKSFVRKIKEDELFRKEIAKSYKAIMVDEFQDMTQDFFDVILEIQKESGAGLMVIGDDDQDILLWVRKSNNERHLSSNYYFDKLQRVLKLEVLNLTINYRSAPGIVIKSQEWINRWLGQERKKATLYLEAHDKSESGIVSEFDPNNIEILIQDKLMASKDKDIAVLCRTNAEVADLYERLRFLEKGDLCKIRTKYFTELQLSQIREVAEWLDICKNQLRHDKNRIYNNDIPEDFLKKYAQIPLPDMFSADELIRHLWSISYYDTGSSFTLKSHIEQIEGLKLSEADRLISKSHNKPILTISTINSVKGLEFDVVFIYPSEASFPFSLDDKVSVSLKEIAREEKQLFYVAATRAKRELYYFPGKREKHWSWLLEEYQGQNNNIIRLFGSPEEVNISWPGYENQNIQRGSGSSIIGVQDYIREKVQVGDSLKLLINEYGNFMLSHKNQWVAKLGEKTGERLRDCCLFDSNL